MNSINVELAKQQVAEFLNLLRSNHAVYESAFENLRDPRHRQAAINRARKAAGGHSTHTELLRLHPLIEQIAAAVDSNEDPDRFKPLGYNSWLWTGVNRHAERLAGILDQHEIREALFEPRGPKLQADRLHPWVWDAAKNLWDSGHYGPAVHDAAKAVERQTQLKINRLDLDGKDLYAQAFSAHDPEIGAPRLRFIEIDKAQQPKRWTSAHEGAQFVGMGCAQGIRNPQAHTTGELDAQEALEQLAVLSVLARWVDSSEVVKHEAS